MDTGWYIDDDEIQPKPWVDDQPQLGSGPPWAEGYLDKPATQESPVIVAPPAAKPAQDVMAEVAGLVL